VKPGFDEAGRCPGRCPINKNYSIKAEGLLVKPDSKKQDEWRHKVSCERGKAERSSSVKDNWSVALGVVFAKKGNLLGPHSGDITVRPQVLH